MNFVLHQHENRNYLVMRFRIAFSRESTETLCYLRTTIEESIDGYCNP
jgi:hypothetical protein